MQADKHEITQQLGVQLRDLRLLDPQLHASSPSALLCRDTALVVNLEHIKCIITKDEVLVLNADEESVVRARSHIDCLALIQSNMSLGEFRGPARACKANNSSQLLACYF